MKNKLTIGICWVIVMTMICISVSACSQKTGEAEAEKGVTEEKAKYSLLETAQKLQVDEFSDSSLVDTCYGLSDPGNVGVNEEKRNEVLYPIPEDEDFEGEILDWDAFEHQGDNLSKLKAILDYATEKNKNGIAVKLNMPKEEVIEIDTTDADSAHFAITHEGLDGFYLQGNGCTFLLNYQDLEWRGFLYLEKGGDVHLQNFTIDYAVSNAVTGIIKSYSKEDVSVTIEVNPEFNEMMKRLQKNEGTVCSYLEYTKATKIPRPDGNYFAEGSFLDYRIAGNDSSGYELTIRFNSAYQDALEVNGVGDYANVAFSYYVFNCLHFVELGNVYLEGVTMHQSPAMGIAARYNQNLYLNRFQLCLKEGSNRLMTSNADAIHILQDRGNVQITNSLFEYSQDDALNLKAGYWYNFSEYDILKKQITITKDTQVINKPEPGDVLEVYDRNTFEKKASLTVVSVEGNSLSYDITVKETLAKLGIGEWENCAVTNTSTAKLLYENNIVRNKRNRGILVMAQNPEIKNNTFLNVAHGSMLIWGVLDRFNEATVPQNVTIKNNKLMNGNYETSPVGDLYITAVASATAPSGTIKHVTIENNFFTRNGDSAVYLGGVSKASINNNLFYETTRIFRNIEAVLRLANTEDIRIVNNYGFHSNSTSISGVYPEGTTDATQLVLESNTELEIGYGVVAEEIIVDVPKVEVDAIQLDGDLSDWTVIDTTVDVLGGSKEDASEAKIKDYEGTFGVNMAKITYDDRGIYLAFDLLDTELSFKKVASFWYGDCVELLITAADSMPNADMKLYKNTKDTIQLVCMPTFSNGVEIIQDRTSDFIYKKASEFKAKVIETDNGYCGEVMIPFSAAPGLKEAIDDGRALTLNCVFADGAREGTQRVQFANVPHWTEQNKKQTANSIRYQFGSN